MLSSRPYLIKALYDWALDIGMTPHLMIDITQPGVDIPREYIHGDQIVLNISPQACRGFVVEKDRIIMTASFSGLPVQISFPTLAVLAIFNKENGRGMFFSKEDGAEGNTIFSGDDNFESLETMPPDHANYSEDVFLSPSQSIHVNDSKTKETPSSQIINLGHATKKKNHKRPTLKVIK